MPNAITEIMRFQTERNLHEKPYEAINEHINIVEELLESVGRDVPKANRPELNTRWIAFLTDTTLDGVTVSQEALLREDDEADAYCDVIVFAIGALMKLGYDPEAALAECAKEINSRTGKMIGGKFEKDLSDEAKANWYKADYTNCKRK